MPIDQKAIQDVVEGLLDLMQNNILSIILYGSVIRGDFTAESDVDIAMIVKTKLSYEMQDALSDLIVELNLKYDTVFSVIDIENYIFQQWKEILPFYRNVEHEGLVLWKAA